MTKVDIATLPSADPGSEAQALAQAVATRAERTGFQTALDHIRSAFDEEANVLWMTNGPRKTRIADIGAIMAEIDGVRRVIVVTGMDSGSFKLYGEVPGKGAEALTEALRNAYGAND